MVIKCIINYFKKHFGIFLLTLFVVLLVTLLALIPPQLLRIIVDDIFTNKDINRLFVFALLYMISFVVISLINFLKEILLVVISNGIGKRIRLDMLKKVNKMSYNSFSKYDSGTLEAFFSNDVDEINTLITTGVISMAIDGFKMIGIIISIFVYDYIFGILTLLIIPLIVAFTSWIRKRMYNAQINNRKLEGNINNLVLENLDNIVTIKSFRIYDKIEKKYNDVLKSHFKTNQKVNTYDAMFSPIMQILKNALIVLIIILATINPNLFTVSVGVLVSLIDLITSLFTPIENLGMEIQTIQKSFAAIKRINDFFKIEEDDEKVENTLINDDNVVLEFKDVTFSYDNKENVLEHFNLKISNNDRLVLKGKSGSGKSTIFKLAYGLIKPESGSVTINNIPTYLLSTELKRKYFGIVYQDYFFSNGTIKEEVTLLNNNISDDEVLNVLKMVGLKRISNINEKLIINDYSTGELAMFNIARAILLNSKVLFLDEMNAKIDAINAKHIIEVIDNVAKNKLVLSINHYGELLSNSKILDLENKI
ncbi:MAG: ABC transporter ATP-binding protein [Candidatus Caccosoma sp.]|nr:ABC transporter ATP-binding protein [Candidatus Caccosoma sp.]